MASEDMFRSAKSGVWAQLLKYDAKMSIVWKVVCEGMAPRLELGDRILFKHDRSCAAVTLKSLFLRIYLFSLQKNYTMVQMGSWVCEQWCWKLEWRWAFYDWEERDIHNLLACIPARDGHGSWSLSV